MKKKHVVSLMLDSGAYSAWKRNSVLSLTDYIAYIKDHKELLNSYVNLDVIPGAYGQTRTQAQVEESAALSYKNQQTMKDAGLSPIPVFHQGEQFSWLEKLLKDGETYIGISPFAVDLSVREQIGWLDQTFSLLTDKDGYPIVKTHGFGVTAHSILSRYPWFTADSTTWSMTSIYKQCSIPQYRDGKPDYLLSPTWVSFPREGDSSKAFERLGPVMQEQVRKFVEGELKIPVEKMYYSPIHCQRLGIIYHLNLGRALKNIRFQHKSAGLLGVTKPLIDRPGIHDMQFSLVFATLLEGPNNWSEQLTELKANTRLVSYFLTRDAKPDSLRKYVEQGFIQEHKKGKQRSSGWREGYQNDRRLSLLARLESRDGTEGLS